MCRHACPVSTSSGRETWIPQAKMQRVDQARKHRLPWTSASLEPIWACTDCRHCTLYCDHGNEPGLVLLGARAAANARGAGHPALAEYRKRFAERERRLISQLREHVDANERSDDAVVGYWPACDAVAERPRQLSAGHTVLRQIRGTPVKVVDSGIACAGYPLLAAGEVTAFREHARTVAEALKRFRTIVMGCSRCLFTLRQAYPAEGADLQAEVLSLSEFLVQSVWRIPERSDKPVVYYHDPCSLSRYSDLVDVPRRILRRIAEVREFGWSREDSECCGGGGLLSETMPEVADAMARDRLAEIARGGGGTVVTASATCALMLRRNAPEGVEVRTLLEMLVSAAK